MKILVFFQKKRTELEQTVPKKTAAAAMRSVSAILDTSGPAVSCVRGFWSNYDLGLLYYFKGLLYYGGDAWCNG